MIVKLSFKSKYSDGLNSKNLKEILNTPSIINELKKIGKATKKNLEKENFYIVIPMKFTFIIS